MDLRFTTPLVETNACDASPRSGQVGVDDARLIAPGEPERSVVSIRMQSLGTTRMPLVGSHVVDADGKALVDAWILSLSGCL